MGSPFTLFALFSLLLIASPSDARPHPAEYWKFVMKDEAMPEAIQGLMEESVVPPVHKNNLKTDCHTSSTATGTVLNNKKTGLFAEEIEPRPNISAYHDDEKPKESDSFSKDIEPRPNISAYHDDEKPKENESYVKDFEPRPNVSAYGDDKKLKENESYVKDFEPRPNISAYHDDSELEEDKSFVDDFKPRPNISVYHE